METKGADKLEVSWDEYNGLCERLGHIILNHHIGFDSAVCLSRGGLHVGNIVSRMLKLPLAVLDVTLYRDAQQPQGEPLVAKHVTFARGAEVVQGAAPGYLGQCVLLLDDLVATGASLAAAKAMLRTHAAWDPDPVMEVFTGVLWNKAMPGVSAPDFFASHAKRDAWIVQPFEKYDA